MPPKPQPDRPGNHLGNNTNVTEELVWTGTNHASRPGKKGLKSSRDRKKCKARTVVERGEKRLLGDPRSELRLRGREMKGENNKWNVNKKTTNVIRW